MCWHLKSSNFSTSVNTCGAQRDHFNFDAMWYFSPYPIYILTRVVSDTNNEIPAFNPSV